jgi:hypothetical protein
LLFGGTDDLSKSITRRVACILHRAKAVSFDAAVRRTRALYDTRSRYVHEGRAVPATVLEDVREVTREVLWALLRVQRLPDSRAVGFRDRWTRQIDYLCSAVEAGKEPTADDWLRAGIA